MHAKGVCFFMPKQLSYEATFNMLGSIFGSGISNHMYYFSMFSNTFLCEIHMWLLFSPLFKGECVVCFMRTNGLLD